MTCLFIWYFENSLLNPVKNSVPDRRGHGKQITVPLNSHDDNNDYGEQRQNVSRSLNCMVKGTMYFTYVQNYITIIQNGYLHCTFDPGVTYCGTFRRKTDQKPKFHNKSNSVVLVVCPAPYKKNSFIQNTEEL